MKRNRRSTRFGGLLACSLQASTVATLSGLCVLLSPATSLADSARGHAQAPDLDVRGARANALPPAKAARPTVAQQTALNNFRKSAPDLNVRWSALTGAPSRVLSTRHRLSGPSNAPARDIANGFMARNLALFNLSARDLSEQRYVRDARSANNGVANLTIQQRANGIDVFGADIRINIDKDGRVLSVGGEPIPGIHASLNSNRPVLSAQEAIARAAASAGISQLQSSRSEGLVYFPVARGDTRLAWNVVVEDARSPDKYRSVVDAMNGQVLWRQNGTKYNHIATHGLVYDSDSPIPNNPIGSSAPVARADRLFHGGGQVFPPVSGTPLFAHADPHYDWWNTLGRTLTTSNNVQAQDDRDGNNTGGTQGNAVADNFAPAIDLTQDPSTYTAAAVVNLFYWSNRYHDITYRYGFTEAFANYQTDNLGLGGTGGDPVIADAQDNRDGGSFCNANFDTTATEGSPGRVQMYQCNNGSPERDGDLSAGTIIHELHHGLASRLTPGLHGGAQGGGIGEGGGDFQDIAFLAKPGDDPNGSYGHSQYQNFNANGNRRAPYSIRPGVYPFTYGDIATSNEVHNNGEIWANALWLARELLVGRYGFTGGAEKAIQLQVDGYKMSPSNPDFIDMRDAILLADQTDNAGANQCLLWAGFARMGIGRSASSTGQNDINPVEAFDTPAECTPKISVNPTTVGFGLVPVNPVGGESGVKSLSFNVCNVGNSDLFLTNAVLQAANPAFTIVAPAPDGYPLPISHDFCHPSEVKCDPTAAGATSAIVDVESSDPDSALISPVTLTCTGAVPTIQASPSPLSFGNVAVDAAGGQEDSKDLPLQVRNTGNSNLSVTGISTSGGNAADFTLLTPVAGFPTIIAPGAAFDFSLRFNPSASGSRSTTVQVASNAAPINLSANGVGVQPSIRVTGSSAFGNVCADVQSDHSLSVCNTGLSNLVISSASVDCPDFTVINTPFPATVSHDFCAPLIVRFTPTSGGSKSCTLTVASNDPDSPSATLPLTGATPATVVNVPADFSFLPEVIQSVGSCKTPKPFPISNQGLCPATISSVAVSGADAGDFSLSGMPAAPVALSPGHVVGEGNLNAVFAPTAIDRDRLGDLTVTYVSDPITGATTAVTRKMCGEGVRTGARVLVSAGGVPLASVEKIQLQRISGNRNRKTVDSVDTSMNLTLQTVNPAASCPTFKYHKEYSTVSNPIQLLPGSYQVTVTALVAGKRKTMTVAFDVGTCDFNSTINVNL